MRFMYTALIAATLSAAMLGLAAHPASAALSNGTAAPDFDIPAAQGGKVFAFKLSEALRKGPVVVYFYPKSFTSVCTVEAHEFAENIANFAAEGASVIGVSSDPVDVQKEFSTKECRDKFPVGADPTFHVIKAYDAAFTIPGAGPFFADRISYVIAPDGKVLSSYASPDAEGHIKHALEAVRAWKARQKL